MCERVEGERDGESVRVEGEGDCVKCFLQKVGCVQGKRDERRVKKKE